MEYQRKLQIETRETECIVINDDSDLVFTENILHKRKRQHIHKQTRKVKIEEESLIVTQKVKVKKQKFRCIINLTNTCETTKVCKRRTRKKCAKKSSLERIVPQCLRSPCQSVMSSKCCQERSKNNERENRENPSNSGKKRRKRMNSMSSISSCELEDFNNNKNISYENISTDSFTCSENELDSLIKRTREKTLIQEIDSKPSFSSSTPVQSQFTSDIEIENTPERRSDTNSMHSMATLVLDLDTELNYSPIVDFEDDLSMSYPILQ